MQSFPFQGPAACVTEAHPACGLCQQTPLAAGIRKGDADHGSQMMHPSCAGHGPCYLCAILGPSPVCLCNSTLVIELATWHDLTSASTLSSHACFDQHASRDPAMSASADLRADLGQPSMLLQPAPHPQYCLVSGSDSQSSAHQLQDTLARIHTASTRNGTQPPQPWHTHTSSTSPSTPHLDHAHSGCTHSLPHGPSQAGKGLRLHQQHRSKLDPP